MVNHETLIELSTIMGQCVKVNNSKIELASLKVDRQLDDYT